MKTISEQIRDLGGVTFVDQMGVAGDQRGARMLRSEAREVVHR